METLLPCNQAADPSLIKVVFHHTIYMKFYRFYIILATWRIAQVYIFGIMLRVIGKSLYGSTFNRTFRTPRQFTIPMTNMTSLVAQTVKHLSTMQETWVRSLGWEDPLEKEMAIHSGLLPGKSHGRRSLVDCSPWGHKESNTTEWAWLTSMTNITECIF